MKKIKLSEDFMIKVLSIALAITLWMYVQGQQPQSIHEGIQTFKDVEIQWTTDSGYIVTAITARSADVTIAGSIDTINLLSESDVMIDLDLTGRNKGRFTIPVEPTIPAGVRVFNITPSQVDIVLDSWVEKTMPVELEFVNDLPENAVVMEELIEPSEVTISGAQDLIDDVDRVVAEYDYTSMDEEEIGVSLKAKNDAGVTLSNVNINEFVDININIQFSKNVPVRLNESIELPEDVALRMQPNTVIILGPQEIIDEIEYIETVEFNYDEIEEWPYEVDLSFPEGIEPYNDQHRDIELIID
jgi:YbbR domain-containing protein